MTFGGCQAFDCCLSEAIASTSIYAEVVTISRSKET